jgi:nicotinamide-nucleotide amidase
MAEALSPALPDDVEELASALLKEVCRRDLMLATAESCTGGLLASLLTDVPGSSHAFDRGFVTYTNDAKHDLLGVPEELLDDPGPVSEVVARAMAEGALRSSKASLSVSITGFAEGSKENEAGLVHFASASRGGETRHREEHFGDIGRAKVRLACLRTALEMLDTQMRGG